MSSNLLEEYKQNVVPALIRELGLKNVYQAPKLEKIVLNIGLGDATTDGKLIESGIYTLTMITGQKPIVTKAKRSVSNFKLREGASIGVMVTLRKDRMYEFLERLVVAALPRVRDFRGLPAKGFDGRGNYTFGIREQLIFPELEYEKIYKVKGMNVTIVTTSNDDIQGKALLKALGMPFRN